MNEQGFDENRNAMPRPAFLPRV